MPVPVSGTPGSTAETTRTPRDGLPDYVALITAEIEAIEEAVQGRFGDSAVESPMNIARLLADEGAALRHSEIMELWVHRFADQPHEAEFRNLIKTGDLNSIERSIRRAENLRKKFLSETDKNGLRQLRDEVIDVKSRLRRESRKDGRIGSRGTRFDVDLEPRPAREPVGTRDRVLGLGQRRIGVPASQLLQERFGLLAEMIEAGTIG